MRAASAWKAAPAALSGALSATGCAGVAARLRPRARAGSAPRAAPRSRRASAAPPPSPNTANSLAVGGDERAHVLHDAGDLHVRPSGHVGDADRDALRGEAGVVTTSISACGSIRARPIWMSPVPGRHVDEQVVQSPQRTSVRNCSTRLREDQPAPHERGALVVDEEAHRHDLAACPARALGSVRFGDLDDVFGWILPSAPPRRPSTPSMRGTLKPQMSASSTPTVRPRAASAAARLTVTDDLPTPPLPLAIGRTRVSSPAPRSARRPRGPGSGRAASPRSSAPGSSRRTRRTTPVTPGRPRTFDSTSVVIWPRSGHPAVVSATLHRRRARRRVDPDVVDHPEIDDAHVQLGVDHAREHAPDVVLGGCRTRDGCVHRGAGVVGIGVLHRCSPFGRRSTLGSLIGRPS